MGKKKFALKFFPLFYFLLFPKQHDGQWNKITFFNTNVYFSLLLPPFRSPGRAGRCWSVPGIVMMIGLAVLVVCFKMLSGQIKHFKTISFFFKWKTGLSRTHPASLLMENYSNFFFEIVPYAPPEYITKYITEHITIYLWSLILFIGLSVCVDFIIQVI